MIQWCIKNHVKVFAAHIPGKKNCLTDKLSRSLTLVRITEWSLKTTVVNQIFQILGTPNVDLFATRFNKQLPVFCSPNSDNQALDSDALSVQWRNMFAYAFPPPILLHKVLMKVRNEECVLILTAPLTPHQSWFPQLLELLIEIPVKLPNIPDLLSQNMGQSLHPKPQVLNLAACKISGMKSLQENFQTKLLRSYRSVQKGFNQAFICS